jgi:hypothetical protein
MDQHADRRRMDGLGAARPLLEGEMRRPAKGEERLGREGARERTDDTPAPPVERMREAVDPLRARSESVPARATGDADENDRADPGESPCPLGGGKMEGAARNEAGAADGGKDGFELHAFSDVRPIARPVPALYRGAVSVEHWANFMHAAYVESSDGAFGPSGLTVGPWDPNHQHAGPPSALICRTVERAAAKDSLTHLGRLTVNLIRPAPLAECRIETAPDYVGRNAGHFSGRLTAGGKEIARFTALMQREEALAIPDGTPGHPLPKAPKPPEESPVVKIPFGGEGFGYAGLVENRVAAGAFFHGPCAAWFRMNHPLVDGEAPSPYQRVAVAADSGNGVSAALDFATHVFVNCDLTINLFRRPIGEWVCLEARSLFGGDGCGLAESALYDETGLIGRATQTLAVRRR